ncbi:MAG: hypothetical protein ACKVI6_03200 [Candidatus Poseidoniales archaeon]|jgi:hypothetical protein
MRRKQISALLLSFLILSSLAFVSQTRPQSSVSSINPNDAEGGEPPITDQDGDMIPDMHEFIFGEDIYLELNNFNMIIKGLDSYNATDNVTDHDNDGATALMEYCWPFTLDTCLDSEKRNTLTGKSPDDTKSGLREYLDPRVADTDGDGLPDGYEIYMCTSGGVGSMNPLTNTWDCLYFDPLDNRDFSDDFDRCDKDFSWGCGDGFDFNKDGVIDIGEKFTNTEEYLFGTPDDWITERDGLWCAGQIQGLSISSCQDIYERPTLDDGWLGTDPRFSDSDYYSWADSTASELTTLGDGIPDGWEAYNGLDPRNYSDSIADPDYDGWDANSDGFITPDITTNTAHWGEEFSSYEEYLVDYDSGDGVAPGVMGMKLLNEDGEMISFNHKSKNSLVDTAINSIISDFQRNQLIIGSKYGISILDPFRGSSTLFNLGQGIQMNTMEKYEIGSESYLFLGTNIGLHAIKLDNGMPNLNSMYTFEVGTITKLTKLETQSSNLDILISGNYDAWRVRLYDGFENEIYTENIEHLSKLSNLLDSSNASITAMAHVEMDGRIPLLFIGTDAGLIAWNTTDGSSSIGAPWWIFNRSNAEYFINENLYDSSTTSKVNLLEKEYSNGDFTGLWLGMAGGIYLIELDLIISQPTEAFNNDRMLNIDNILDGANDIRSIFSYQGKVLLGSKFGTWCLEGNAQQGILGMYLNQTIIPGLVTSFAMLEYQGEEWIFGGISPGEYMNIIPLNPLSNDSDLDGMSDGWEFVNGLDPTDPYDGERDMDNDGVQYISEDGNLFDRLWTNLDEFRFSSVANFGDNSTDPRNVDSDGDGLSDGEEYWGWFPDSTNFNCHYLNGEYICDGISGENARAVHLEGWLGSGTGGGTDGPTDPTNSDTDGDGMPDGWEIENRRWIGDEYTGGNRWTLDPLNSNDAYEDADGDGLDNICEYRWSNLLDLTLREGLPTHGETSEAAKNWTHTDPNSIDSDGDTLPDGWEARYSCNWSPRNVGINPLNGSDYLNNPDGDGFDVNSDGILSLEEQLVNWMEYYLNTDILYGNSTSSGLIYPDNFSTKLYHESWQGFASDSFGDHSSLFYSALVEGIVTNDIGSSNPLDPDSDKDGMPDGWEFYHARWSLFEQSWSLNLVNEGDNLGDPDGDGMNNWEEYNVISSEINEISDSISSPQFFLMSVAGELTSMPWIGAESPLSFGDFLSDEQTNVSGLTADPNNPDTDSDGILDGIELIFTKWNSTDEVWTLNPLVPGDGKYDSDSDGITDILELNMTYNNPINGGLSPSDAPKFWNEADNINHQESINRIYRIIFAKEGRASLAMQQFIDWELGMTPKPLLESIFGITDPNSADTDRDGMSDGYEYWFTEWDLEQNSWTMNPLSDYDVNIDSDLDSFDCNGDGIISDSESYDNLAEYDARIYGKRLAIDTIPNGTGLVSYGKDAIIAQIEENGLSQDSAKGVLYSIFSSKSISSFEKIGLINEINPDNFNISLAGISDPNDADSDRDGMPDGWEYCYSIYGEFLPINSYRWSLNPLNPLDVNYDPDADGWYDRNIEDVPANQGTWINREFSMGPITDQINQGTFNLYFSNLMEYHNQTHPLDDDTDHDSIIMNPVFEGGIITNYVRDTSLSDGREIFKYGTNPLDNDTDGDMMPDFYEFYRGWNETNDNWSSLLKIEVQWYQVSSTNWKPVDVSKGYISRPNLNWTWFTHDATSPIDAGFDADNDGDWNCSSGTCTYVPYTNFQEYYATVNATLSSPSLVRAAGLYDCSGEIVEEWWQLRQSLLGTCSGNNAISSNYLRMNKINDDDMLYSLIIDDNDDNYEITNTSDDLIYTNGAWTDQYNRFAGDQYHLPNVGLGEFVFGWWVIDIDGDMIAEGTDPSNWDTDGDWLNDYFEINDDLLDGIRGNSGSPIRYDDRTT